MRGTCHSHRQNAALHEHLAVKFAPDRFAPAGIGYCQMDAVGGDIVPVFGGSQMREGICMRVHSHLRVTGGAGREIDYHGFIIFRINSFEMRIGFFHVGHEVVPAVALAVDDDSRLYRGDTPAEPHRPARQCRRRLCKQPPLL